MRMIGRLLTAVLLGLLSGCSSSSDGTDGGLFDDLGPSGLGSGASPGPGLGGAARPRGGAASLGPDIAAPCEKVDIVFAVDGSESMTEELVAMRDTVFPAFARRLREVGQGVDDFRVGVIDACPRPANLHARGRAGMCNFLGGNPWVESASSNFNAEIACVGDLFQNDRQCSGNNDDEQPASAVAAALESAGVGGPNEGFMRGDALTIVIAITDEDEQPAGGAGAQQVYQRLIDTVAGDPRRMVFLGIGGARQCQGVYGDTEEAATLKGIVNAFDDVGRGVFWDLCEGRLEDGLSAAFDVIENACDTLPPPITPPATPLEPCGGLDEFCGGQGPPEPPPEPLPLDGGSPF